MYAKKKSLFCYAANSDHAFKQESTWSIVQIHSLPIENFPIHAYMYIVFKFILYADLSYLTLYHIYSTSPCNTSVYNTLPLCIQNQQCSLFLILIFNTIALKDMFLLLSLFELYTCNVRVGVWFDSYKSTIQSRITKETVNDFPFALRHHERVIYINHLDNCPISVSIIYKYFSFMFFYVWGKTKISCNFYRQIILK